MANNENLVPFNKRSVSEARECGRKGGIASGKTRKRKADFRKTLNILLTTEVDLPEWKDMLNALGLECTLESAVNASMIREALAGNVKAYEAIARYSGQSDQTDADLEEQKIRTERSKRARDQEVGDTDSGNENIENFLKAMNPTDEDMAMLFPEEEEVEDAEDQEETGEV